MDQLKLVGFAKTSGSRGLHVLVPFRTGPDADEVVAFAESFVVRPYHFDRAASVA